MTAAIPQPDQVFSIRLYKSLFKSPKLKWANTYEVQMGSLPSSEELMTIANRIALFESEVHLAGVNVMYGTVSTYVPDSKPYNPENLLRVDFGYTGQRTGVLSEPQPLHMCLRLTVSSLFGRAGFRLYRGVLVEEDVSSPAGEPGLANTPALQSFVGTALTQSQLSELVTNGDEVARLVMAGPSGVRNVTRVGVAGVTIKALNNKYFDKKP